MATTLINRKFIKRFLKEQNVKIGEKSLLHTEYCLKDFLQKWIDSTKKKGRRILEIESPPKEGEKCSPKLSSQ